MKKVLQSKEELKKELIQLNQRVLEIKDLLNNSYTILNVKFPEV